MGSLLQEAMGMKKRGEVKADLRRAALVGMALQVEKQAVSKQTQLGRLFRMQMAGAQEQRATRQMLEKLLEDRAKGPTTLQYLAPLLQPLAAVATGLGLFGGAKLVESWGAGGVEDEVVKRFESEYLATGRDRDQWRQSGFEGRIRDLYKDLRQIAPDVASKAPAALSVIRPVAQRPHMPNFTEAEVKDLASTQQAMRGTKPAGGEAVSTVQTIWKMSPQYTDVINQMAETG